MKRIDEKPVKAPVRLIVRQTRHSELRFGIPVACERSNASEAELRRIQERFKDLTPQECEILRKLGFKLQQGLRERRQRELQGLNQHTSAPLNQQSANTRPIGQRRPRQIQHQSQPARTSSQALPTTSVTPAIGNEAGNQESKTPQTITSPAASLPQNETVLRPVAKGSTVQTGIIRPLLAGHSVQGFTMAEARALGLVS